MKAHGDGISGVDFSSFIESFADYARGRAEGIGQRQYFDGAKQRFEFYSAKDLIDETLDELADVVNYSAMLAVKLLALKAKVT